MERPLDDPTGVEMIHEKRDCVAGGCRTVVDAARDRHRANLARYTQPANSGRQSLLCTERGGITVLDLERLSRFGG
jgi:hypothetical protein